MKWREEIINNYIDGYNQFNVDKMLDNFADDIVFNNIQNGEVNLTLTGIIAFREQAEQAKSYFSERQQSITGIKHFNDRTEVDIDYRAVLASDWPNGLKKGHELRLSGRSIFEFKGDKIIKLTDIS